jgi:hypothetical protein
MDRRAENIAALSESIPAPMLGSVPFLPQLHPQRVADHLNVTEATKLMGSQSTHLGDGNN